MKFFRCLLIVLSFFLLQSSLYAAEKNSFSQLIFRLDVGQAFGNDDLNRVVSGYAEDHVNEFNTALSVLSFSAYENFADKQVSLLGEYRCFYRSWGFGLASGIKATSAISQIRSAYKPDKTTKEIYLTALPLDLCLYYMFKVNNHFRIVAGLGCGYNYAEVNYHIVNENLSFAYSVPSYSSENHRDRAISLLGRVDLQFKIFAVLINLGMHGQYLNFDSFSSKTADPFMIDGEVVSVSLTGYQLSLGLGVEFQ